ncbi:MAG: hypothetical protein CME65_12750 [Halobacteriovoraceae bacterium]|nr:hypothetical protein [Halobacteriovoraceae bacterium]|tara:strand:- start:530 stop:925 length:396 start_codon:yes stop_codon:yes gene_type:complete
MDKIEKPTRIFLGSFFTIFGLNGLVMISTGNGFIPMPAPTESFAIIMGHLLAVKFIMPVAKIIQVGSGIMLLNNKFINLALVLLAPILFSIVAAHLVASDFAGVGFGLLAFVAWTVLIYLRRQEFIFFLKK